MKSLSKDIQAFNNSLDLKDQEICNLLANTINSELLEANSKIWHNHPVWFLNENPIVGYSKQKAGIRLMFWSGAGFDEPYLKVIGKKFKDASVFFNEPEEIDIETIKRCLNKATHIQWDYKNIVKRKGHLIRL